MSARDDCHGGRLEHGPMPAPGPGLPAVGRCDECGRDSAAGRARAKVKAGPLRGIHGMVCGACIGQRLKAAA